MARPRTFDEGDVIAAARDEFWSRGYAATSVDDLTIATGLGKGSLYGAFGDKHGLYLRALDDYIESSMDVVRTQLRDPTIPARDRLVRHIRGQVKAIAADKDRRGCMMAKGAAELGATDDAVGAKVERAYSIWRDELTRCVTEAQRDGAIDGKHDPRALAGVVLAFMRGQDALHKGGAKATQLKMAAEQMIALLPGDRPDPT